MNQTRNDEANDGCEQSSEESDPVYETVEYNDKLCDFIVLEKGEMDLDKFCE